MRGQPWHERVWYGHSPLAWPLLPLSAVFCAAVAIRRVGYAMGLGRVTRAPVPVIVVGNITVGGTGKTPLVIWLIRMLREQGWHPGVISRGYGGRRRGHPVVVGPDSTATEVGDEPVLIARRARCPVVVDPQRNRAVRRLLEVSACDIVVSDDGLQHYRLQRDMEIVVVDAGRGLGNGHCLPAGPLREPPGRLHRVDFVIYNGPQQDVHEGFTMRLEGTEAVNIADPGRRRSLVSFRGSRVAAVAGIGNPDRFFDMLRATGLDVDARTFPDHHPYQAGDLEFAGGRALLMTEKDAVKVRDFAGPLCWAVPVTAQLQEGFAERLGQRLNTIRNGH